MIRIILSRNFQRNFSSFQTLMKRREGLLVGMGNPLLDISADCEESFLTKYDLKANDAILASETHLPMYKEIVDKLDVEYIAGGATLNTMRVCQWLVQKPNVISYFGCIGNDDYGKKLVEKATEAGVNMKPQINAENDTGTCGVLITNQGANRSLVANLAAANHFKRTHFDQEDIKSIIDKADYFYIGGFFLTVSPESILEMAKHATDNNKYCMTNLSAPFLCQFFAEPMMKFFPYVDVLFGNETEAVAFAKQQNFGTEDVKEIALKASSLEKINKERERIVIFTQGKDATIVASGGKVTEYVIIPIEAKDIIDTNGAGDSFVGGFLSQFMQGKDIPRCVQVGNYAANYIIQQSGVTLTGTPNIPAE